ncbi:MAG: 23S rRNA (adenine(2503)-C(2))-methyltransferase RlmN [Myxococcales bacterium]|nr:23S rRNA (adenine(2503)-C(2))-methyltransferase RlmN [Myxococcales bacterium]
MSQVPAHSRGASVRTGYAARVQTRPCLKDYSVEALRERLGAEGWRPYRAEQIAHWLYARGAESTGAMTDLSREDRARLDAEWALHALSIERVDRSRDGTIKAVLRGADSARIESVLIPEDHRTTLCLSTQVGCGMACSFCATGAMGFTRNLSTAEIVDQFCRMRSLLGGDRQITNVVFMGMGEPLLNRPAVEEAIRIFLHPRAFALAPRRVTVSTVGVVPQIAPLLENVPVNLAVSLHASSDAVRERLVPLNRSYPLAALLGSLRDCSRITRRRPVFFEYTLIDGVNDSLEEARRLPALFKGIPCKLNLIPMNPHPAVPYRPSPPERVDRFLRELATRGVTVTLRRSRGPDIAAACGQLALSSGGSQRA